MRCPRCGAPSFVRETRGVRRRRECFNKHRFSTVEVAGSPREHRKAVRLITARAILRAKGYLS